MSILINNHPIFEDNQVLTSVQLNQSFKYLDLQTRLTRSCLIGMGIGCGLELQYDDSETTKVIIKEGLGISSEGFLIKLCPEGGSCVTTQYRAYNIPENTVYTPFQNDLFVQDVDLYELLTEDAELDEDEDVFQLSSTFLADKVVVLFLECLDYDLKSCLGKSCDELGVDRIFTLRKLLISVTDLIRVNQRSNGGRQDDLFLKKYDLKSISLPRVFFDQASTVHYFPFAYKYVEAIQKVYAPLKDLLNGSYVAYEGILHNVYGENPFNNAIVGDVFSQLEVYLSGGLKQPSWWGIQYVYDFIKDLIMAYDEFRACAYDLMVQCCPDMTRFPRHLMLGKVIEGERDKCQVDLFRHAFTQPPIYNNQKYLLAKTLSLHKRMVLMLEKFSFERLYSAEKIEGKATPSCEKKSVLSKRSIPFYYDSKSASKFEVLETLEIEWNYERKFRQCQLTEKESNALNLSYDNNIMGLEPKTPITTPLHFDIDQLNFLRLEGFHGKGLRETMAGLNTLKHRANLSFDIETIYFGDTIPDVRLLECFYKDLQPDYEIWRGKLLYFLEFFARFTNISRFLSSQRLKGLSSGSFAATDKLAMEPLETELNLMRNLNVGLNKRNWTHAVEEVYFDTKSVNMGRWTSVETEKANLGTAINDKRNVGELHEQITKCIAAIRANTPEKISNFKMADWLESYKCPLTVYMELVKLLASRIPRGANTKAFNTIMRLYCALHEVMRNLFIFPYIDARIFWNTLKNRLDQYKKQHQFTEFAQLHPGLEHKAGVEPGGTFVLLVQAEYSDRSKEELQKQLSEFFSENEKLPFSEEDVFRFEKELFGKVVGDFTLPYKCCDPCNDIGSQVAQLDPIALPICEVVPVREVSDNKVLTYGILKEKLFHTMYEPERYRAKLLGGAQFGNASLEFYPFEYDKTKNTQGFIYEVDIKKVAAEAPKTESAYLIDTIPYDIWDADKNEKVDGSVITVIVPILAQIDSKLTGFRGTVFTESASAGNVPISGAEVWTDVQGRKISDVTKKEGIYELKDAQLSPGSYTLRVTAPGYYSAVIPQVQLKDKVVSLDIALQPFVFFAVDERNLLEILNISENSTKAVLINEEFKRSAELYRDALKHSIEAEKDNAKSLMAADEAISRFNKDEKLTIEELNEIYTANRNVLLEEINTTKSSHTKKNRSNVLRVLTNSYMDRLIQKEPGKLSETSAKTVAESGRLIAKSGVAIKDNFNKWSSRKEEVVGTQVVKQIKDTFKI